MVDVNFPVSKVIDRGYGPELAGLLLTHLMLADYAYGWYQFRSRAKDQ